MSRQPLPRGYEIKMSNGGTYTIRDLIGEGGFSLIYSADMVGGTSSVVIKEFFPANGAFRDQNGRVVPTAGNEERFNRKLSRYEREGAIGGKVSESSYQTVSFLESGTGFAVMKRESKDMRSLSDMVAIWEKARPKPVTGNSADQDPVFADMVRVRYALRIIESVLAVLSVVHDNGYLHLDISGSNVIWAGSDVETGENCEAFLADFGSSVEMDSEENNHEYQFPYSYSHGFAAPEVLNKCGRLTPATDIYAVGILLFYLCVGESALKVTHNLEKIHLRKDPIQRESEHLSVPMRILTELQKIIVTATGPMSARYQTANSMLEDVRTLRNSIPIHPLNPDNTGAFSLYSLKSMLTGSEDSHYSWADELRDRRGGDLNEFPKLVYKGLSFETFDTDEQFLTMVLPEELCDFLKNKIDATPNKEASLRGILSCNYDFVWKRDICKKVKKYGTRRLLEISRSLMRCEKAFFVHKDILFQLLGKEGERLRECFFNCDVGKAPYVGLAMLTMFALLGPDGFEILLPSPRDAGELFYAL